MTIKFFQLFIVLLCSYQLLAQDPPKIYNQYIAKADSLHALKQYKDAGRYYSLAFESFGWKGVYTDRIKAACSWSQANVFDSAFFNLHRIVFKSTFYDKPMIDTLTDLNPLHSDPRWVAFIDRMAYNKEQAEIGFDKQLIKELDSLKTEDQKWRSYARRRDNKELVDTLSQHEFDRLFKENDSLIALHARNIFKRHGFPGSDLVGWEGTRNFWLLIQHNNDPEFQDSVLVKMKQQVDKNLAIKADYAYLIDRRNVNRGQAQIYGTQMRLNADSSSYEPKPTIDPENLNKRRAEMDLPTEEEYIDIMNKRFFGTLKRREKIEPSSK